MCKAGRLFASTAAAACLLTAPGVSASERPHLPQVMFSLPSSRVCRDAESLAVDLIVRNNTASPIALDWSELRLTAAFTGLLDTEHMAPLRTGVSVEDRTFTRLAASPFTLQPGVSTVRTLILPMDRRFFSAPGFYRGMPLVSWNGERAIGDFIIELRDCAADQPAK